MFRLKSEQAELIVSFLLSCLRDVIHQDGSNRAPAELLGDVLVGITLRSSKEPSRFCEGIVEVLEEFFLGVIKKLPKNEIVNADEVMGIGAFVAERMVDKLKSVSILGLRDIQTEEKRRRKNPVLMFQYLNTRLEQERSRGFASAQDQTINEIARLVRKHSEIVAPMPIEEYLDILNKEMQRLWRSL